MTTRLVAGCMTGTSMDAVDLALVRIEGEGLDMEAEVVRQHSQPLRTLAKLLRPLAMQRRRPAEKFANYAHMLGMTHMIALRKLIDQDRVDLIAVHGQTIFHQPPLSWQLLNPGPIAQDFGVPIVFDFRLADLSCGGQGAPITPLADHVLFRSADEARVVLNLGGFINFTWLPASPRSGQAALGSIRGGDICACNQLLDAVARKRFRQRYDDGGGRALIGHVCEEAEELLTTMLDCQASEHRSLGTGDETIEWVKMFQDACDGQDMARTACAVIANVVARHVGDADRIIVAGGGTLNEALMTELREALDPPLSLSDEFGVAAQYREAAAMAVLGALCQDRVPITLPQITGVIGDAPVAGCWMLP